MSGEKWSHLAAPTKLKHWRTEMLNVTQKAAADRIGIDANRYCAFEKGRQRPAIDIAAQIERVTDGHVKAVEWAQAMELDARRSGAA